MRTEPTIRRQFTCCCSVHTPLRLENPGA